MTEQNVWNKNWAAWKEDFKPSPFAQKAFKLMKIKDLHDVLDLGCGKGRNSLFFAANGMNVTAMDISDEALKTVEELRHPKIRTLCADISKADLGAECYDVVFACLSLHYFGDAVTRMIVDKVRRSLRAGGLFFAANGMNVTAMDISDEALKTVEALRHPKIRTVCADISKADLEPERYDAVFACLSLHYFGDAVTRMIVDKVHRSMRSGGLFFIRCKSVKDKAYGVGEKVGEDMYFDEWTRHFFRPEYMKDILSDFETAAVCEAEEDYFGLCHFVDGIAVKANEAVLQNKE